jgi:hypothetical protein
VLFRLSAATSPNLIAKTINVFAQSRQEVAAIHLAALETATLSVVTKDNTDMENYATLLALCRGLQNIDMCNHLSAEFVDSVPSVASLSSPKHTTVDGPLFESFFSGQYIRRDEPLHPDNADDGGLALVRRALDKIAGDLIAHPERLMSVPPRKFEEVIAEIYRSHGFDVGITGGPRDHGIDVAATIRIPMTLPRRMSQHLRIGIQVKRYKTTRKVREAELRNLFGSIEAEGYDRGVLVTTSSLTAAAKEYVTTRRAVRDRLMVLCGDDVLELLVGYCKQRWVPFWR